MSCTTLLVIVITIMVVCGTHTPAPQSTTQLPLQLLSSSRDAGSDLDVDKGLCSVLAARFGKLSGLSEADVHQYRRHRSRATQHWTPPSTQSCVHSTCKGDRAAWTLTSALVIVLISHSAAFSPSRLFLQREIAGPCVCFWGPLGWGRPCC